jgi:hypothetical protein
MNNALIVFLAFGGWIVVLLLLALVVDLILARMK